MIKAAAIYARISSDRVGDQAGVKRQVADCEAEAARRGWPVAQVYVDDDVSAYSGKQRPEYQRLIADVTDGLRDAVLVWHLDRLTRRPKELEEFVEVCERAGMKSLATVQGDVNLGTGDGLLVARIMGAVAANESTAKSRRVKRKLEENAKQGRPHGGRYRPFGYRDDKVTLEPAEAAIIRDMARRFLAGETLTSLVRWLEDNEHRTVAGGQWTTTTLRNVLRSARISGQREHKGEIVGPAMWPAIITPEQTARIRALLDDPSRRTNRTARRYLLSGLLVCGRCTHTLYSHPRRGQRRYACKSTPGFGGCGQMTILANPTEQLIADAVQYRLDSPALADALAGRVADDSHAAVLHDTLREDQTQLEELAALYGDRSIGATEWMAARKPIEARIATTKRQLAAATRSSAIDEWVGNADTLRGKWEGLNLTRQVAIVKAVLDHAVIGESPGNSAAFSIDRVTPAWRL
jgi:DNA invertase Pin-like site-specific DNA recombinase